VCCCFFFFSSRRRHTRSLRDWSSDVYSSDLSATCPALEIELSRFSAGQVAEESWLSLDRPEDRTAEGRPGPRESRLASLEHIDEIGRASCRERVESWEVAGAVKEREGR